MKLLLYCTKSKPYLIGGYHKPYYLDKGGEKSIMDARDNILNGKIVAECDYEVEEIYPFYKDFECEDIFYEIPNKLDFDDLLKKSCLDNQQLDNYLYANKGYAIHIKNLHIFDEPKELDDYYHLDKYILSTVKQAPQNMCYVYENPLCSSNKDRSILISIKSKWLCKIINGEKTIEVRKKVLKEML